MFKKLAAAVALAGIAIAAPAQARDGYYRHDRGGDDAAIAIGAGVVGLALGAALASGSRDRDYYYEDGYYPRQTYYQSYPQYYGGYDSYYYGSYPQTYYRSYPRNYYRGGDRRWSGGDRHWNGRRDRGHDRGDYRRHGRGH